MWNKLRPILQNKHTRTLGLALLASMLVHVLLLAQLDLSLANLTKQTQVIEARIEMPKATIKPAEPSKPQQTIEPAPEPAPVPQPKPIKAQKIEELITPEIAQPAPLVEPVDAPLPPAPVDNTVENPEPKEAPKEEQPADNGLVMNENAYQYVETDFDVRTKIDGSADGSAKIIYEVLDGKQYQLKWVTQASGLAALVFPDLLQTSQGEITTTGLQPNRYLYELGNKTDKTRSANFDWPNKLVTMQTAKGSQTADLEDGTQDLLSFMYQFMHVAPLQSMRIPIVNGKKLRVYDYSFEGEETIDTKMGALKTMHIVHAGGETDEKTEIWLAIDYQHVPVKIRKTENDGKVVELSVTRIKNVRAVP